MQTWGLRLLALGIALGLWFNFSFEVREAPSERLLEASVSYNRPRGSIVIDPVPSVNVRLRGSSKAVRRLNSSKERRNGPAFAGARMARTNPRSAFSYSSLGLSQVVSSLPSRAALTA